MRAAPLPIGSGLAGCVCGDGDATGEPLVPSASFSKVRRALLDGPSPGGCGEPDMRLAALPRVRDGDGVFVRL